MQKKQSNNVKTTVYILLASIYLYTAFLITNVTFKKNAPQLKFTLIYPNNNSLINSNVSVLQSTTSKMHSYDWEGKWGIGIILAITNVQTLHSDNLIFDIFNNNSLKYNNYNTYSSDDIMEQNKHLNISFIADPFLYIMDDKWYLFYELKNLESNRGEIAVSISTNHGSSWKYLGIVLKEHFHLSYPNIIHIDNEYAYMIPETNEDYSIRIYASSKNYFPFNWNLINKKLVPLNLKWADTSIVYYNERYYIFTTDVTPPGSLFIFYTNINTALIDSKWHQHSMNPFYRSNKAYFRNGGNIFYNKHNNKMYRFTQQSNDFYGVKVHIFLINKLNPNEYNEKFINTIEPSMVGYNVKRIHHLNINYLQNNIINIVFDFDSVYGPNQSNHIMDPDNHFRHNYFDKLNIDIHSIKFIHKLPKIIHFIWISDNINIENQLDEKHKNNIDSFRKLYNNDWKIIVWTNKNIRNVFCGDKRNEYTEKCNLLSNESLAKQFDVSLSIKSDMLRYLIMETFGGVYFDADFIAVQNMNDIISIHINENGLILCNYKGLSRFSSGPRFMSVGFFAAYPKNKFVTMANTYSMSTIKWTELDANDRIGPHYFKRIIVATYNNNMRLLNRQMMQNKRRKVTQMLRSFNVANMATELPMECMYSLLFEERNNYSRINELIQSENKNIYAIHLWDGSWLNASLFER